MSVYYNEIDHFCCEVIRKNIKEGNIPDGRVDERDIRTVRPDDLAGFRQVHLFAGIGGAAYAARLAGAERVNLWTFGFPCQDISCAGKGEGIEGERSGLFFQVARLLRDSPRRPDWLLAENVPALRKRGADRVLDELEGLGYAVRPVVVGAEHVGAPHKRHRAWFMGYAHPDGAKYRDLCDTLRHLIGDGAGDEAGRQEFQYGVDRPSLADPIGLDGGGGGEVSFGEAEERTAAEGAGRGELADTALQDGRCRPCEPTQPVPVDGRAAVVADTDDRRGGEDQLPTELRATGFEQPPRHSRLFGGSTQVGEVSCWPSRPGEPQYDWEAPRLIERGVGGAVDGIPPELVRGVAAIRGVSDGEAEAWFRRNKVKIENAANKHALKAYGNSWVPQCAALVLHWIAWADEQLKEAR